MTMTGKERAALRSECNRLKPTVHVGADGLTAAVASSLDEALEARELVKVSLTRNADVSAREAAQALAARVRAEVIQTIGRTATLYRRNTKRKPKPGAPPPWRT